MIYMLPFIAAAVGWFTNYLAVKMLFHPKEPVNILGMYTLHGIFPKNQKQVAEKIGKMVADELLSSKDLRERIITPENIQSIVETVEDKIEEYFSVKIPQRYPTVSRLFLSEKRKTKIVQGLMKEVDATVPVMVEEYFGKVETDFNVEHIIREKVNQLPPDRLENLIMKLLKREFKFIEYIGAVIGFAIGWIQVLIMAV